MVSYISMYNLSKERIVATIEARMTSSRLPGKVLFPITGVPALEMLIERLKRSTYIDVICVATTINTDDDPIVRLAHTLGVEHFRGSEDDVLSRVLGAAQSVGADLIVEITGDCPFVDPALVDRGIEEFYAQDLDYAANNTRQTYADGFDVRIFRTKTLREVDTLTNDPIDRVHVSYYIPTHPEKFKVYNWTAEEECHAPQLSVTLDEEEDYHLLCTVAEALAPKNPNFTARDVTQYLLNHPEVVEINKQVRRKKAHEL